MEDDYNKLLIQIEAQAKNLSSLDTTAESLNKLAAATNQINTSALNGIAKSFKSLSGVGDYSSQISSLTKELKLSAATLMKEFNISESKFGEGAVNQIRSVVNEINNLTKEVLTSGSSDAWNQLMSKADSLANSLGKYGSVKNEITNTTGKSIAEWFDGKTISIPNDTKEKAKSLTNEFFSLGIAFSNATSKGIKLDEVVEELASIDPNFSGMKGNDAFDYLISQLKAVKEEMYGSTSTTPLGLDNAQDVVLNFLSKVNEASRKIEDIKAESKTTVDLSGISEPLSQIAGIGDGLQKAGEGLRSFAESIKSIANIDAKSLQNATNALREMTNSLGGVSSNNNISIKADSSELKEAAESASQIRSAINTIEFPPALRQTGEIARQIKNNLNNVRIHIDNTSLAETAKMVEVIKATLGNSGSVKFDVDTTPFQQAAYWTDLIEDKMGNATDAAQGFTDSLDDIEPAVFRDVGDAVKDISSSLENAGQALKNTLNNNDDNKSSIYDSISKLQGAFSTTGFSGISSGIGKVSSVMKSLEGTGIETTAAFQKLGGAIEGLGAAAPYITAVLLAVKAVIAEVKLLIAVFKKFVSDVTGLLTGLVNVAKTTASGMTSAFKGVASVIGGYFKGLGTVIGGIFSKVGTSIKTLATNAVKSLGTKIKNAVQSLEKSFEGLFKKLAKVTRLFTFMLLRKSFTALLTQIKTGFNNLVLYSDHWGTQFTKSVDSIYQNMHLLGNSFATVLEPILNYLAPLFDILAQKMTQLANAMSQFFALLTGAKTWTKAKKGAESYADSLKDASKAQKDFTLGIDELNIINDKDNSADAADMFETKGISDELKDFFDWLKSMWEDGDFTNLGKKIGEWIINQLMSIDWNKIRATAKKLGKSLATLLNGILEASVKGISLGKSFGHTLAQAINTAFEFLNGFAWNFHFSSLGKFIMDSIEAMLDELDWDLIKSTCVAWAKGFSDLINSIFSRKDVFSKIGDGIANCVNNGIMMFSNTVKTLHWNDIGESIGNMLHNALTGIKWADLANAFAIGINGLSDSIYRIFKNVFSDGTLAGKILEAINTFFAGIQWEDVHYYDDHGQYQTRYGLKSCFEMMFGSLGQMAADVINGLDAEAIGTFIGNALNTLFGSVRAFLDGLGDFTKLGQKVADTIKISLETIDWVSINATISDLATKLADFFNAIFGDPELADRIGGFLGNCISTAIENFHKFINELNWADLGTWVGDLANSAFPEDTFEMAGTTLADLVNGLSTALYNAFHTVFSPDKDGKTLANKISTLINSFFENLKWDDYASSTEFDDRGFPKTQKGIKSAFKGLFADIGTWISETIEELDAKEIAHSVANGIDALVNGASALVGNINGSAVAGQAGDFMGTLMDDLIGKGTFKIAGETLNKVVNGLLDGIQAILDELKQNDRLKTAIDQFLQGLDLGTTISNWIKTYIAGANTIRDAAIDVGAAIITGMFDGVDKTLSDAVTWVDEHIFQPIIKAIKSKFGIESEDEGSKEGSKIGKFLMLGLEGGVKLASKTTFWDDTCGSILSAVKNFFGIESPSTVFRDEVGAMLVAGLNNGITDNEKSTETPIKTWANNILSWFTGGDNVNEKTFSGFAGNIIKSFKDKIDTSHTDDRKSLNSWTSDITKTFGDTVSKKNWEGFGSDIVSAFKGIIAKADGNTRPSVTTWAKDINSTFEKTVSKKTFESVGKDVVEGFKNGVGSLYESCRNTIENWGGKIISWFKDKLDSHSPSRVFEKIGQDTIQGYQNGLSEKQSETKGEVVALANSFTSGFSEALSNAKLSWDGLTKQIADGSELMSLQADKSMSDVASNMSDYWDSGVSNINLADSLSDLFNKGFNALDGQITGLWTSLSQTFSSGFKTAFSNLDMPWDDVISLFTGGFNDIDQSVISGWGNISDVFSNSFTKIIDNTDSSWGNISSLYNSGFSNVISQVISGNNSVKSGFSEPYKEIEHTSKEWWDALANNNLLGFKKEISDTDSSFKQLNTLFDKGSTANSKANYTAWKDMQVNSRTSADSIYKISNDWTKDTSTLFGKSFTDLKTSSNSGWLDICKEFVTGIGSSNKKVSAGWVDTIDLFKTGLSDITDTMTTNANWGDLGGNIVKGIWKGIKDGWGGFIDKMKDLAREIKSSVEDTLEIASPSKVFKRIGGYIVEGLNIGVDDNADSTRNVVKKWASSIGDVEISAALNVDTSKLSEYTPNYGAGFTTETLMQRVNGNINGSVSLDTNFESTFENTLNTILMPVLNRIDTNAQIQAEKDERPILQIGSKVLSDVVAQQKKANGFSFQPT